jgi:NADPH2:quinone reductase
MKAIEISEYGGREVLRVVDVALAQPGPDEVLIRLDYVGVNLFDIYIREGLYAKSPAYGVPFPVRLGIEGAGVVASVGPEVEDLAEGDRVTYCEALGSYAEYASVPAERVVKIPDGLDAKFAAAVMLQGMTAHYLTHATFPLKPGDTCLIHAGSGGVGQLLIRLAKLRGARVFATVGHRDKVAVAKACGADEVILYRQTDFREAVLQATGGVGVDVVYDSVGRDTIDRSLGSLRPRGTCALFGHASGPVAAVEPRVLGERGSLFLTRPHLIHYILSRKEYTERASAVLEYLRSGKLEVTIDRVFPLEDVAEAHRRLESRKSQGKILLRPAAAPP